MIALVRAELLKIRTTRSWWGYLTAVVVLVGIATAGNIGSTSGDGRSTVSFAVSLVDGAGIAALLAIVLGITVVTTEFRHGTVTPAFLAEPRRERVLAAKALATTLVALFLDVVALLVVVVLGGILLAVLGAENHLLAADSLQRAALTLLVAVLWGLLGVSIGSLVHGQVAAIVGTLIWIFLGETLLWGLFALLHVNDLRAYLPFQALDAADGTGGGDLLSTPAGIAVSLGWIAGLGAVGLLRTRRRDIS